jgi:hypothetical protein
MRRSSAGGGGAILEKGRGSSLGEHVLNFLGGLPEEEIWADRRTEDANDHGRDARTQCQVRPERSQRNLAPRNMDGEQHGGIGQQRKRQPLQEEDVAVIWHEDLEQ